MKVISYSLFGDPSSFEFPFYLRGLYFNARMNALLYPGWSTCVAISETVKEKYLPMLMKMPTRYISVFPDAPMCESMLWRMAPIFWKEGSPVVTHVICRDTDAITTYKEAQAVQEWIDSGFSVHGITDNPAHSLPMMGGMVGFRVEHFKQLFPQWTSFEEMIKGQDLRNRGSDQDFMMKKIYPKAKDHMMGHFFDGCREKVYYTKNLVSNQIQGVDTRLWESNLTCRHIGSPGIVDMETLRFFQRFDKTDYSAFEKEFSNVCYWAQ